MLATDLFCSQPVLLVIIRVRRSRVLRQRMFLQLLHHDLDCFIELRVMSLTISRGVEIDLKVGSDAVILHFPFAFEPVDRGSRCRNITAIEQ